MTFKQFWKESFLGFIAKNVILAIIIIVALAWGTLIAIDFYTHHGESVTIPDLRGQYVEEAEVQLSKQGLFPQVIDSVYVRDKRPGTIVEQVPPAGSAVKSNRAIYLIINAIKAKKIPLPDVRDVSYRQASAMLTSVGLSVSSVVYTPSEYKDLVVDVKYHGQSVNSGLRLPEGASLVLVVGSGTGETSTEIPSVKGLKLDEASIEIVADSFVVGAKNFDVPPSGNEKDYFIYRQSPPAGSSAPVGTHIDLWLSTDKSMLNKQDDSGKKKDNSDEQFF